MGGGINAFQSGHLPEVLGGECRGAVKMLREPSFIGTGASMDKTENLGRRNK